MHFSEWYECKKPERSVGLSTLCVEFSILGSIPLIPLPTQNAKNYNLSVRILMLVFPE